MDQFAKGNQVLSQNSEIFSIAKNKELLFLRTLDLALQFLTKHYWIYKEWINDCSNLFFIFHDLIVPLPILNWFTLLFNWIHIFPNYSLLPLDSLIGLMPQLFYFTTPKKWFSCAKPDLRAAFNAKSLCFINLQRCSW